jgi:hypothetical protein
VVALLRSRSVGPDGVVDIEMARAAADAALVERGLSGDVAASLAWLHRHDPAWRLAIEQAREPERPRA